KEPADGVSAHCERGRVHHPVHLVRNRSWAVCIWKPAVLQSRRRPTVWGESGACSVTTLEFPAAERLGTHTWVFRRLSSAPIESICRLGTRLACRYDRRFPKRR